MEKKRKTKPERDLEKILRENGYDPHNNTPVRVEMNLTFTEDEQQKFKEKILANRDNARSDLENKTLLLNYLTSEEIEFIEESEISPNEEINNDFLRLSRNKINYDYHSGIYYKYKQKIDLRLADDKEQILNNIEIISEVLISLTPLLKLVLGNEFYHYENEIGLIVKAIKEHDYNTELERENLLLNAKGFTIYLVTKTARIINHFLVNPQFTLEEFKQLINTVKRADKLNLVEEIDTRDVKPILESLSRLFPELKVSFFTKQEVIEPRLFQNSNLTKTSTSLVLDAVVAVMVSGKVSQKKIKDKHFYTKDYKIGSINIIFDLTLEALQQQYGIEDGLESIKVLEALLCHWYARKNERGDKIRISGNDILTYLDMRYKNYRGSRCRKYENLKWLLNHCRLLKKIDVCSGIQGITPKNKKPFSMGQETSLIEINLITNPIQLDLNGKEDLSTLKDLIIEFKAGDWFKFFDDVNGLMQYGYLHQVSFSSRGMQSALLTILPIKLRQTQSGQFKIKTLLEESGYREQYEEVLTETDSKIRATKAKDFKNQFDKAIKEIEGIEDPYSISYHHSTPEWVNTRKKKPTDWFSLWLDVTLQIREPQCLDTKTIELTRNKPVKQNNPITQKQPKLTVESLQEAMSENQVTIRPLAEIYGVSYSWLQRRLKEDNFNQNQLKDLITQCQFLGKKNKRTN